MKSGKSKIKINIGKSIFGKNSLPAVNYIKYDQKVKKKYKVQENIEQTLSLKVGEKNYLNKVRIKKILLINWIIKY